MSTSFTPQPVSSDSSKAQSKYLQLRDGTQQHYLYWPNANGMPPCVLLHGFTNDARIWDGLAGHLQALCPVYAIDFRGHGDSGWDPQARYTHETLREDIAETLKALQLAPCHIIAHSLGARIASLYLAQYQPAVLSFTMIDTGPEVGISGANKIRLDVESTPQEFTSIAEYQRHLEAIYLLTPKEGVAKLALHGLRKLDNGNYSPKTDPAFTKALWKPAAYDRDQHNLRRPMNEQLWQALRDIHMPTLVMRGKMSAILPARIAQRMVNEFLPAAELQTIDRAGHAVMLDNPEGFHTTTLAFIQKHQGQVSEN